MKIKEPEFRCGGNWQELADLFDYEIDKHDQDWTYTIVESDRIEEYIQAYDTKVTNEDTKFSLMEMIIQSLTEQEDKKLMEEKWKLVKPILNKDFDLHEYTIYYWCCWDNDNIDDCWEVTPLIREFWIKKK
jgi:sulfur relay (sulfurtransferase) DsrC/TusE family protein